MYTSAANVFCCCLFFFCSFLLALSFVFAFAVFAIPYPFGSDFVLLTVNLDMRNSGYVCLKVMTRQEENFHCFNFARTNHKLRVIFISLENRNFFFKKIRKHAFAFREFIEMSLNHVSCVKIFVKWREIKAEREQIWRNARKKSMPTYWCLKVR